MHLVFATKTGQMDTWGLENWEIIDEKVKATIFLPLSQNIFFNVLNENTTKDVWDKPKSMYKMALATNKIFIMKKLYKLKMKEGTTM